MKNIYVIQTQRDNKWELNDSYSFDNSSTTSLKEAKTLVKECREECPTAKYRIVQFSFNKTIN